MTPRRPLSLHPGDRLSVVAPASAVDAKRLVAGVRRLESLGYVVDVLRETRLSAGRFAGSDAQRARAFLRALGDRRSRAIVFARGGFGAARILPLVASAMAEAEPKILVGYSDATSLLAHASGTLGWVTFHGPMVASDFGTIRAGDARHFLRTLAGEPVMPFGLPVTLRRGQTEGRLLGGCLSIVVAALGTPYAPDLSGSILFLEEVNEEPYQLDRMLTQLRLAGVLGSVAGIAFAEMTRCGRQRERIEVLRERTADLGVPVAYGLPSGHGTGKRTVPLGVRARLDATSGRLEILEPAVRV